MKFLLTVFLIVVLAVSKPISEKARIWGRLNVVNGYATECIMHRFFIWSGWVRLEGEVGRNGIDGLYYKKRNGVIKEVLVAESKWNKSRIGASGRQKLIKQMSKKWILCTLKRLQKYRPLPEYTAIKKLVENDQYRARLFRMFPDGNNAIRIWIHKLKNKGSDDYDIKTVRKLKPITIGKPKNDFQAMLLDAYNECRAQGLRKYFSIFDETEIRRLMKDNYLQPEDVFDDSSAIQ